MFRISGLSAEAFAPLFELDDAALYAKDADGGRRRAASRAESACRTRWPVTRCCWPTTSITRSPRMRYAVFVRRGAIHRSVTDEVPDQLARRTLAARSFDAAGMSVAVVLVEGAQLAATLERLLGDPCAAYVHLHYAAAGCYAARADRA